MDPTNRLATLMGPSDNFAKSMRHPPARPSIAGESRIAIQDAIYLTEALSTSAELIDQTGNIFAPLNKEEYRTVIGRAEIRRLASDKSVLVQGERYGSIFIIQTGRVRTFYISPTGREYTLAYWTPGHFVGVPEVFGTGENLWGAVTESPTTLAVLKGSEVTWLVRHVPTFALALTEGLIYKGRCLSTAVQMLGTRSMTSRLASLLLTLRLPVPSDGGGYDIYVRETFTHEELAKMIGSSRQWVTITLKRFQQQKLIRLKKSRILITQPDALKLLVE